MGELLRGFETIHSRPPKAQYQRFAGQADINDPYSTGRHYPGDARRPVRRPARALGVAEPDYHSRKEGRQGMMAIAGPQIVTGGASAPPALNPHATPRTIADGALARVEDGHAEAP